MERIPESAVLKRVRSFIHNCTRPIEDEEPLDQDSVMERALEVIRVYYRQENGIGYLDRMMDSQVAELAEVLDHYRATVRKMVSDACVRHGRELMARQINRAFTQSSLIPALEEAGMSANASYLGAKVVLEILLPGGRELSLSVVNPGMMSPGEVAELIGQVKELKKAVGKIKQEISIFSHGRFI